MTDILYRHRHWNPDQGADLSVRYAVDALRRHTLIDCIEKWQESHGRRRATWRRIVRVLLADARRHRDAGRAKLALAATAARRRKELGLGDR